MSDYTSESGAPLESVTQSLSAGTEGPLVLHDASLVEKLAHFNRERIPERVVHAKGSGAFGNFKVTNDLSQYTKAKLFQPNKETELVIRFSSVAGEMGSPDTWRDLRGFAVKFYTEDGNYDIVGNNTPVFFINDPMLFPDFIRSQKRTTDSSLRSADMQWDFWTLRPESAHQVAWLMGDRGIPKTWRHMDGFGSHTYQWINENNERFWVKYHFKTMQGNDFLTQDEATRVAGENADYYREDLFSSIENKNFPKWALKVQIMPYEDAKDYRFNPFDVTKVWSQKDYPLQELGIMTLDRNPENMFNEIEQLSLSPSNLVPGIGLSPDKMLLGRIFAYPDAQRYRVGANFNQLPVNSPKVSNANNYSKEGFMSYKHADKSIPPYGPNYKNSPKVNQDRVSDTGRWEFDSEIARSGYINHSEDGDFVQAHMLVRDTMDDSARDRLLTNIMSATDNGNLVPVIKARVVDYWKDIDSEIGNSLEKLFNK